MRLVEATNECGLRLASVMECESCSVSIRLDWVDMNLRFLETFVWVARLKSFRLAAEKLFTTQAAVSNRIVTLERELGVRLFDRGNREVQLTHDGLNALEDAEAIVRMVSAFRERIAAKDCLRGTIRIGVIDTIAHSWLVTLIERSRAQYPSVAFELHSDTSLNIAARILSNQLDLGLLMGPVIGTDIVNLELCTYACVWVASPRAPLPAGRLTIADLAAHPILSFPANSKPYDVMRHYFRRPGEEDVRLHTSNSLATIIRMVCDGIGVAALPAVIVGSELNEGRMRILDVDPVFPPLSMHASFVDTPNYPLPRVIAGMARDVASAFSTAHGPGLAWPGDR